MTKFDDMIYSTLEFFRFLFSTTEKRAQHNIYDRVQLLRSNKMEQHRHAKRAFTMQRINKRHILCQCLNPRHPVFSNKTSDRTISSRRNEDY